MATEKNFGMRLTPAERRAIERLAEARDVSMKDAVLEAVQRRLTEIEQQASFAPTGRLKNATHLIGSFDGSVDLTTNPDHLEGYGT